MVLVVVVALVALLPAGASAAPAPLFTFRDPQIAESSGIVASATRDDVFFTHNDSGDTARFFAVDRYGCTIGVFTAPGVMATDWEDIARGPGNSLWLGDIGDNSAMRNEIAVHRFNEPVLGASTDGSGCPPATKQTVAPESYRLRFEDGPHDAETLLVDPRTSQVFIITKSFTAGALYAAPNPLNASDVNVLRKVTNVATPALATGGDISSNGQEVAVRNYWEIDIRTIPNGNLATAFAPSAPVQRLDAPDSDKQGEGLGFTRTGRNLLTSSEGVSAPVFLIPLTNGGAITGADTTAPAADTTKPALGGLSSRPPSSRPPTPVPRTAPRRSARPAPRSRSPCPRPARSSSPSSARPKAARSEASAQSPSDRTARRRSAPAGNRSGARSPSPARPARTPSPSEGGSAAKS